MSMAKPRSPVRDFERALLDPAAVFGRPADVLSAASLRAEQKIEILFRWAYDARELAVAEEEGMGGGETTDLGSIAAALHAIGAGFDLERAAPTKHGAFCAARGWSEHQQPRRGADGHA
jgi:hypothetical protein